MFRQLSSQVGRVRDEAGRIMNAITVAAQTGLSVYRNANGAAGYDFAAYTNRMARYDIYELWYDNVMFDPIGAYLAHLRARTPLYRHIREIYNPVQRLAKLEASKTYGGVIDWTGGLKTGAIPVVGADERLLTAITQILKWSNFGTEKGPYVLTGAKKGDSFLKIIDDTSRGRVRLEVVNPRKVRDVAFDEVGNIKWIAIQYYLTDADGKDFLYREEIDVDGFRYWREYGANAEKSVETRAPDQIDPNPYGFVPVRHTPHRKEDDSKFGRTSFAGSMSKIVQLNDLAAPVHDAVRNTVEPFYVGIGGRAVDTKDSGERDRDEVKVMWMKAGSDFKAVTPQLDTAGALATMNMLIGEIERDMPQLSLQRIREAGGNASGVSIENSYSDASDLLEEIQGNYDQGLISAIQMAISIGTYRGYDAFKGYDPVTSYERGDLDFYIKPRPVFSDRLTEDRKIELLLQAVGTDAMEVVAQQLGYSEEDIALMSEHQAQSEANAMRGLSDSIFGALQSDAQAPQADTPQLPSGQGVEGAVVNG